jgi:type II secretory pathway component PulM
MELDFRMLFSLGTALCTVVASMVVVRQKVAEIEKGIEVLVKKVAALDTGLDTNNMTTENIRKATDVLREINSPEQLRRATRETENHAVRLATIETQTIPFLRERIKKLEHIHNGKHPST